MNWRDDKALIVLGFFTLFFTIDVLAVAFLRPSDGVLFQAFMGMMNSFGGAILLHLKSEKLPPSPPPGSTVVSESARIIKTEVPPEPPSKEAV